MLHSIKTVIPNKYIARSHFLPLDSIFARYLTNYILFIIIITYIINDVYIKIEQYKNNTFDRITQVLVLNKIIPLSKVKNFGTCLLSKLLHFDTQVA